jgi:hypothetical protein
MALYVHAKSAPPYKTRNRRIDIFMVDCMGEILSPGLPHNFAQKKVIAMD